MDLKNKYLKYKKKYNLLKIQYAGEFTEEMKIRVINSLFPSIEYIEEYDQELYLLQKLLEKLELDMDVCSKYSGCETELQFKICDLFKKLELVEPIEPKAIVEGNILKGKIDKIFPSKISSGNYGEIFVGKINKEDENTSLIKMPIRSHETSGILLINEAYINLCIINDYMISNPKDNQLIFTYGLLFLSSSDSSKKSTNSYLNINLIQQTLDGSKTLKKAIESKITLEQFFSYITQVFEQLSKLEQTQYELIHEDLHYENILIFKEKAYIIDWGISSFIADNNTFRIRSNNNLSKLYFIFDETKKAKTGLYDLYFLLTSCKYCRNQDINPYINYLLNNIFFNNCITINIIGRKSISLGFLKEDSARNIFWLYHIIGGTTNSYYINDNFSKIIYDLNECYFTEYTYDKILSEIKRLYYKGIINGFQ